jgi:hypothetical protein
VDITARERQAPARPRTGTFIGVLPLDRENRTQET